MVATVFKNPLLRSLKSVMVSLLNYVMAFLCTKFILLSNECAQCLFSCIGPPFSASINLHKIPGAAAILVDMAPTSLP